MISTATVQEALTTYLKADANVTGLTDDIREESWMGTDYSHPNIRIHITRLTPLAIPGLCDKTSWNCEFSVGYRSPTASSKPAADGIAVVNTSLIGVRLSGSGFVSRDAIKSTGTPGPTPESETSWYAPAMFMCRLQETPIGDIS